MIRRATRQADFRHIAQLVTDFDPRWLQALDVQDWVPNDLSVAQPPKQTPKFVGSKNHYVYVDTDGGFFWLNRDGKAREYIGWFALPSDIPLLRLVRLFKACVQQALIDHPTEEDWRVSAMADDSQGKGDQVSASWQNSLDLIGDRPQRVRFVDKGNWQVYFLTLKEAAT